MSTEKFSPVDRPAPSGWRRHLTLFFATGAGFGYSPVASGTVGALWGIPILWALHAAGLSLPLFTVVALVLCVIAVPVCHDAEAVFGRKDDGRIVADEYVTFPLCMIGLPFDPVMLVIAFLTHRFFDILKLPPAAGLQRITGGLGIVIDDVAAAVYSLAANHALWWAWRAWMG